MRRNTAPAIVIAALKALEIYEDPIILILSSDHQINDENKFVNVMRKGIKYSREGKLVIFGITPKSPEVGYGYIKAKKTLDTDLINAEIIESFIEKPDKDTAKKLILDNRFSWNSGIFLFKASSILREIKKFSPEILEICSSSLKKDLYDLDFQRIDEKYFSKCPNISIDVAVMEKTKNALVLPLDAGWSDVGSWDFVWKISKKDNNGNVIEGNVITQNTQNSFLSSNKRLIAAIGLKDLVVIETSDAIMVANKSECQKSKRISENTK